MTINGIICVNKPKDFTSFDVVAVMRKLCATKKIGHGGTLDPMATGVLPIFLGNATKAVDFAPEKGKEYVAGFRLGLVTDTQDITGKTLEEHEVSVTEEQVYEAAKGFVGKQRQLPPMYSAVSVGGVRLYDLARQGKVVERETREIDVPCFEITDYKNGEGTVKVSCSKGTYIRTLIHDFGMALGTGAVMTSLVRTRSGVFTLSDCMGLDELREMSFEKLSAIALPLTRLYAEYPKITLDESQKLRYRNGAGLDAERLVKSGDGEIYAIYDNENELCGLGTLPESGELAVIQRFAVVRD